MDEKELQPMIDSNAEYKPVTPLPDYETDYTEELDLEEINETIQKYETNTEVQPNNQPVNFFEGLTNDEVVSTQVVNEQPVEPVSNDQSVEVKEETPQSFMSEHPDGKIKLNFDRVEEVEEDIKPSDIKIDIKGNKSLLYVLGLGVLLLVVVLLLPLFI